MTTLPHPNTIDKFRRVTNAMTTTFIVRRRCAQCHEPKATTGGKVTHGGRLFVCAGCCNGKDSPVVPAIVEGAITPAAEASCLLFSGEVTLPSKPNAAPEPLAGRQRGRLDVTVMTDSGRHTVIYFGKGRKNHRIIRMRSGCLRLENMEDKEFSKAGLTPLDYPVKEALEFFINHRAGAYDDAADLLHRAWRNLK